MKIVTAASNSKCTCLLLCLIALLILAVVVIPAPDVWAQGAPPQFPALCYGELTVNGKPAPVGTKVVAKVDGTVRGELVTSEAGWYGGPGLKSKLVVSGDKLIGKMVRFYVSGTINGLNYEDVFAWEELYWGSGEVMQINLGVKGAGSSPTADPPAVPVPKPLPAPTESQEDIASADDSPDEVSSGEEPRDDHPDNGEPAEELTGPLTDAESNGVTLTDTLSLGWIIAIGVLFAVMIATTIIAYLIQNKAKRIKPGQREDFSNEDAAE